MEVALRAPFKSFQEVLANLKCYIRLSKKHRWLATGVATRVFLVGTVTQANLEGCPFWNQLSGRHGQGKDHAPQKLRLKNRGVTVNISKNYVRRFFKYLKLKVLGSRFCLGTWSHLFALYAQCVVFLSCQWWTLTPNKMTVEKCNNYLRNVVHAHVGVTSTTFSRGPQLDWHDSCPKPPCHGLLITFRPSAEGMPQKRFQVTPLFITSHVVPSASVLVLAGALKEAFAFDMIRSSKALRIKPS